MTESKELDQLFRQAQAAFDERDWPTAIDLLKEIIGVNAEYPDAYGLLKEAQKRRRAKPKYERGLEYYEKGDWAKAVEELEAVMRDDPDHPNAPAKLEEARQWAEIEGLLGEADEYQQKSEWERVVETLKSLLDLQKPKLDFDWDSVKQRLAEAQEKLELARLYQDAGRHFEQKHWRDALQTFEELEKRRSGYRDVAAKLEKVRKQQKLEKLYLQAQGYEQSRKWPDAFDSYEQIYKQDRNYQDVVDRMAYCNKQLRRGKDNETPGRTIVHSFGWFLLGLVSIGATGFFFARPFHCLLQYKLPESVIVIIGALLSFIVMYFANLIGYLPKKLHQ